MRLPDLQAAASLAALALLALPCRATEGLPEMSPLGLRTQGTLRELFLDVTAADARSEGTYLLDVRYSIANDWGVPTALQRGGTTLVYQLDEQADSLNIALRVPWSRLFGPGPWLPAGRPLFERISTTFELRGTLHWGGWTDAPIEAWHEVSGAFNFDRDTFPRNRIGLYLGNLDGAAFDVQSARLAFGDIVVRNQVTLFEGGYSAGALAPSGELRPARALAARIDVKLPTGSLASVGGSGGFDAGVALLGTAEVAWWLTVHGLASLAYTSNWSTNLELQPKPWHGTAEVSLVAAIAGWAFIVEDRVVTPLLMPGWSREEAGGNDGLLASSYFGSFRAHNQLSFALRRGRFSFWLSEDFTPGANPRSNLKWLYNSNAPDVVLGLAYRREL